MILENEPSLLKWLSNRLDDICEADPVVLAQYVVALLKHHDKKGEVLKNHCTEQLLDFLKKETEPFLDSLFNVLRDGSYKLEAEVAEEEVCGY
jgi:RNA-binding protein 26